MEKPVRKKEQVFPVKAEGGTQRGREECLPRWGDGGMTSIEGRIVYTWGGGEWGGSSWREERPGVTKSFGAAESFLKVEKGVDQGSGTEN